MTTAGTGSIRDDDDDDDDNDDDLAAYSSSDRRRRSKSAESATMADAGAVVGAAQELGMGAGAGVTSARGKRLSCIDHLFYTPGTLALQ